MKNALQSLTCGCCLFSILVHLLCDYTGIISDFLHIFMKIFYKPLSSYNYRVELWMVKYYNTAKPLFSESLLAAMEMCCAGQSTWRMDDVG